ncbi:MAG: putative metal-binding motif-containing protein [Alphaproteobacteria bacterium]|nr:putative metal-binding motif-containing protein [Alphaproteobacteria bacterium]
MRLLVPMLLLVAVGCAPEATAPALDPALLMAGANDSDDDRYCTNGHYDDDDDGQCQTSETAVTPDCDDGDPTVNPGVLVDACNGVNDDCDAETDEDATFIVYYPDIDGDTYGDLAGADSRCDGAPAGYVTDGTDCNDLLGSVNPGIASDTCNGVNDDCDAETDEDATFTLYYLDADGDGYGDLNDAMPVTACAAPAGRVADQSDCNDGASSVNPGIASDTCNGVNDDCDGQTDEDATFVTYYPDDDNDTYGAMSGGLSRCDGAPSGYVTDSSDCDDGAPAVNTAATEICNGIDDDCVGGIDDGLTFLTYYLDADNDGYGDENDTTPVTACSAQAGRVTDFTDCDDAVNAVHPTAVERCNGRDDNCINGIDEGHDDDSDGVTTCGPDGVNNTDDDDCDDDEPTVYPGAPETCNGIDEDCDTVADNGLDVDGDGVTPCGPDGTAGNDDDDCRDDQIWNFPGNSEICDGRDNDCDTDIDEGAAAPSTWYADVDGDGYGDPGDTTSNCSQPVGYVGNSNDCDDDPITGPSVHPGAGEVLADGIDQDCDGFDACYADGDGDGFGAGAIVDGPLSCTGAFSSLDTDCDDGRSTVFPLNPEICDGLDNDCAGGADDGLVFVDYYPDDDLDGFGDIASAPTPTCDGPPAGYLTDHTDCHDDDANNFPGNAEVCDGADNDCDNTADNGLTFVLYYPDDDGDGFGDRDATALSRCDGAPAGHVTDSTDCDDDVTTGPTAFPGAAETTADGIDQDCDGTDPCYEDLDGDGFGTTNVVAGDDLVCTGAGESGVSTDCNDGDALEKPDQVWYVDCDGDLAHDITPYAACDRASANTAASCPATAGAPTEILPTDPDCDDTDATELPGQVWYADCDGDTSRQATPIIACSEEDADLASPCDDTLAPDSWSHDVPSEEDCDDEDSDRSPTFVEACEPFGQTQVDDDCDGDVNGQGENGGDPAFASEFHEDFDLDGFGAPGVVIMACEAAPGLVPNDADCDDIDPSIHIGADEICDGRDQNCNQLVDEADFLAEVDSYCIELYRDRDGDGYGDQGVTQCLCVDLGTGDLSVEYDNELYVATFSDCDDLHADIKPHECNDGSDNDGDGAVDENDDDCTPVLVDGVMRQPTVEGTGTPDYVVEILDGHDNDCDGFVPYIELDCDDDGSLPALPVQPDSSVRSAADVGLADCSGPPIQVACWEQTITLECDPLSGLWVTRWGASADGFGGRFSQAYRNLASVGCDRSGDCDDLCSDRCPGVSEICDGIDNDCSGITSEPDDDGIPTALEGGLVVGTLSPDEMDLDGDGFAACIDSFRASDAQTTPTYASCTPTVEEGRDSDCDDGCYLANSLATEQCNGFRDLCDTTTAVEGVDADGDGHRTCGVRGPVESELVEQLFAVAWVACTSTSIEGCEAMTASPPAGAPSWVPLLLPRAGAPECDAPLGDALEPLLAQVGAPALADLESEVGLLPLCAPESGGFCTTLALVNDAGVDSDTWLELAVLEGTVAAGCEARPEQYHSRSVWPSERIVASRELVVEAECYRMFGAACDDVDDEAPVTGSAAPPDIDDLIEREPLWWQSVGRYQPSTTRGAVMTCWGDPIQGVGSIEDAVGGDCSDDRDAANRDMPEGPDDLLGIYLGDPGDCDRCTDGIDNNCDGRIDCEDPSCAICYVGEARGCRGTRDPCNVDQEGGGCQSSGQGGSAALLGVALVVGLRTRRRRGVR